MGAAADDSGLGCRRRLSRLPTLSPRPPAKHIAADLPESPAKDCGADLLELPPRFMYLVEPRDMPEWPSNMSSYFTPDWCLMKCVWLFCGVFVW
jgi:hypothetical protein